MLYRVGARFEAIIMGGLGAGSDLGLHFFRILTPEFEQLDWNIQTLGFPTSITQTPELFGLVPSFGL